jgi:hypothetical protein
MSMMRSATLASIVDGSPDWGPYTPRERTVAMHFPHDNQGHLDLELRALVYFLLRRNRSSGKKARPTRSSQKEHQSFAEGPAPGYEVSTSPELAIRREALDACG